ncbi:MAG: hypothetical protein Q9208_008163 [Pyrenodesmia sp. 3 TL-2023]
MSPHLPTPAADNLADVLDFQTKEKIPSTVTFLPAPPPPPRPAPSQPPPLGPAAQLPQQPQLPGLAGIGGVGGFGSNNPTHTSADPVRYTNWGPKTLYFLKDASEPSSSKPTKKRISKKSSSGGSKKKEEKEKEPIFERVILSGSEEMQTTETTEVLGLNEGGGVKKTWVLRNTVVVMSVEKEVTGEDVRLSGGDGGGMGKDKEAEKGRKGKGAEISASDMAKLLASGGM